MWVVPVMAYVASLVLVRAIGYLDDWLHWQWTWKLEVATVESTLQGMVASTISFIVFAFSSRRSVSRVAAW